MKNQTILKNDLAIYGYHIRGHVYFYDGRYSVDGDVFFSYHGQFLKFKTVAGVFEARNDEQNYITSLNFLPQKSINIDLKYGYIDVERCDVSMIETKIFNCYLISATEFYFPNKQCLSFHLIMPNLNSLTTPDYKISILRLDSLKLKTLDFTKGNIDMLYLNSPNIENLLHIALPEKVSILTHDNLNFINEITAKKEKAIALQYYLIENGLEHQAKF